MGVFGSYDRVFFIENIRFGEGGVEMMLGRIVVVY